MKEILKTIGKYKLQILFILILLFAQAYTELELPSYTSKIVDTGIQSGGIESIVPEVLSEKDYNLITNMLDNKEKSILEDSYNLIDGKYKLIKENEELESILLYPISIVANIDKFNGVPTKEVVNSLKKQYEGNESFIEQSDINYIKNTYKELGIDVEEKQMNYIYSTGGKMLIVALISMGATILSVYLSSKLSAFIGKDLRNKVMKKIMTFETEELNKFSTSSLITRCTNDIVQIQTLIMMLFRIIIFAPIMGIGAITKVSGSPISWVVIVSVCAVLLLMLVLFLVVVPKFKKMQDLLDRMNLVFKEILEGIPVIRAFANEKYEEKRFEKANDDITKNGLFIHKAMAIMEPTLTLMMNSVSILIVWVSANNIDMGTMQVGSMIAFITYTMQIIMSFLMVSMVLIMLPRATISLKRVSEVLNTESKIKDKEKTLKLGEKNEVEFRDVYFRYPDATEDVLRNISFKATEGTTTAFIGSTGSGKSTLINLIPRFYDVTSGEILVNGRNIKDVKLKDLRELIGYVPQKGNLFSGTILSNITFGLNKPDREKALASAKISQALEFINEDKDGLDREISQGGTNVSGGQRQRLSIARAICKDPKIYVFDDSFSALDYKTDAELRKELNKITKDKIVFVVAQRISSVMHADNIIVLDNGEIVGMGTHEELLKSCPIYKEIKISQLGGE